MDASVINFSGGGPAYAGDEGPRGEGQIARDVASDGNRPRARDRSTGGKRGRVRSAGIGERSRRTAPALPMTRTLSPLGTALTMP